MVSYNYLQCLSEIGSDMPAYTYGVSIAVNRFKLNQSNQIQDQGVHIADQRILCSLFLILHFCIILYYTMQTPADVDSFFFQFPQINQPVFRNLPFVFSTQQDKSTCYQESTSFVIVNSIVASQAVLGCSNNMTFADKVLEIMSCCHDRVLTTKIEDQPKIQTPVR